MNQEIDLVKLHKDMQGKPADDPHYLMQSAIYDHEVERRIQLFREALIQDRIKSYTIKPRSQRVRFDKYRNKHQLAKVMKRSFGVKTNRIPFFLPSKYIGTFWL